MDPIAARKEHDRAIRRQHSRLRDARDRRQDARVRLELADADYRREHDRYCDLLGVNRLSRILIEQ